MSNTPTPSTTNIPSSPKNQRQHPHIRLFSYTMLAIRQCLRCAHHYNPLPFSTLQANLNTNYRRNQKSLFSSSSPNSKSQDTSQSSATTNNDSSGTYTPKPNTDGITTINIKDRVKIISIQNGRIIHVQLSRPSKLNSLDIPMFQAIAESASILKYDTTINKNMRVIIISGEGRAFCTGLDAKSVALSGPSSSLSTLLDRPSPYGGKDGVGNLAQDVCYLWR